MPVEKDHRPESFASKALAWSEAVIMHHRLVANVVLHSLLFAMALILANLVRLDISEESGVSRLFRDFLTLAPFFVVAKLFIFGWMKLYRGGWQYASIRDITNIVIASWFSSAIS